MFGRLLDVYIYNETDAIHLVDSSQGNKSLVSEIDIKCLPNKERTSAVIKIYNLSQDMRRTIKSGNYKKIIVKFGYKDLNGGVTDQIFMGTLMRTITQRPSPETSCTIYYAYELGDAYAYGFFSGYFNRGTSLYEICETIANTGEQKIPIEITSTFKNIYLKEGKSFYGPQIELLQQIASSVNNILFMQSMGKVYIITTKENDSTEVIVMSGADEKGTIVSASGLIGLPTLEDDGISFECLVNPRIRMYSTVLIANKFISDAQEGFERQSEAGAVYDENGLYVVTKIETHISNDAQQSKMKIRALARSYYVGGNK